MTERTAERLQRTLRDLFELYEPRGLEGRRAEGGIRPLVVV